MQFEERRPGRNYSDLHFMADVRRKTVRVDVFKCLRGKRLLLKHAGAEARARFHSVLLSRRSVPLNRNRRSILKAFVPVPTDCGEKSVPCMRIADFLRTLRSARQLQLPTTLRDCRNLRAKESVDCLLRSRRSSPVPYSSGYNPEIGGSLRRNGSWCRERAARSSAFKSSEIPCTCCRTGHRIDASSEVTAEVDSRFDCG
jgi:hypothetical protein